MVRFSSENELINHNNSKKMTNYQRKLQEHLGQILYTYDLMIQNFKLSISQLCPDVLFDSIEKICNLKMKSIEIKNIADQIQEQLINLKNKFDAQLYESLKTDIRRLKKDIKQFKFQFEEQILSPNSNFQSDNRRILIETPLTTIGTPNQKHSALTDKNHFGNDLTEQANEKSPLTYIRVQQISPSILDLNQNELDLTEIATEKYLDENREIPVAEFVNAESDKKIKERIHLTNNIVVCMQGPVRTIVHGVLDATEAFATRQHVSDVVIQAVNRGVARQKQVLLDKQTNPNDPINSAFAEITSDWIHEGENAEKGFSSDSIWMRNPQGEKILVKTQDLLLCAANEWLAYALGKELGLPVNKVQLAIHEKNLVTLHFDVNNGNEETLTLDQLPRRIRKQLMKDPIIGSMDLFDRIIQNADRNPLNILITKPNSQDIDNNRTKLKIHFIDHGACFGMGKRNGLSVFVSKLHTDHISIAKFHPVHESRKFDHFLSKLSPKDRILLGKTLNRLTIITNEQIDNWLKIVQDLFTSTQYNRIHSVLYYQRDIARRYVVQWGIDHDLLNRQTQEMDQITPESSETEDYF